MHPDRGEGTEYSVRRTYSSSSGYGVRSSGSTLSTSVGVCVRGGDTFVVVGCDFKFRGFHDSHCALPEEGTVKYYIVVLLSSGMRMQSHSRHQ